MNEQLLSMTSQALMLVFQVCLPVVLASAVVGLLISLVQAVTHIQDQTLPFLLKLSTAVVTLMLTGHWMHGQLERYLDAVFETIGAASRLGR